MKPAVTGVKTLLKTVYTNSWTLKAFYLRLVNIRKLVKNLKNTVDVTVSTYFLNYQQFFKAAEVEHWGMYE